MTTPSSTTKTYGSAASNSGDHLASAFDGAGQSALHAIDGAADALSNKVDDIRSQAGAAATRGMDALRDSSRQLRETAGRATDSTIAYVKDEPVKAVLLAAATGALLMGFVSLLRRAR